MAGVLLGLLLSLHAAVVFPALHEFWHGAEDEHSECQDHDCVVLAFASGSIDPGPSPHPVTRPAFSQIQTAVSCRENATALRENAEPPGRGPPHT